MKQKILHLIIISILSNCSLGCKKFVEIPAPSSDIVAGEVFKNSTTATAALTVIYAEMSSDGSWTNLNLNTGLSADELINFSSNTAYSDLYLNKLVAADGAPIGFWSAAYKFINQANVVIEQLSGNNAPIDSRIKSQLVGEAKFLRGYLHFVLANLYGDVPIVLSSDYVVNGSLRRLPKVQVIQQVIVDLKESVGLLGSDYVDQSDTLKSIDRFRPNKMVATALLARVALYNKDYKTALAAASEVLADPLYKLEPNLSKVFLKNSAEAIWQLAAPSPGFYTFEGTYFVLTSTPSTVALRHELIDSFAVNDLRRISWIDSIVVSSGGPGLTYYYPHKYRADGSSSQETESSMMIRLAEMYLIRAEAKLNSNDNTAVNDLNFIRQRAGIGDYTGATDFGSIYNEIIRQRNLELFTEGHRWMDLKRTGRVDLVMEADAVRKGSTWNAYQQFYPIPLADIQSSTNLSQTSGY